MLSINSHIKAAYVKLLEYIKSVRDIMPNGMLVETVAIIVFVMLIFPYNKMIAGYTVILFGYGMWTYCAKDGKIKLALFGACLVAFIFILYIFVAQDVKIQMVLKEIVQKGRWSTWMSCITVNSFVFSKVCNKKVLVERVSCALGYIMVILIGLLSTTVIECFYIKSNQNDNSMLVNIICLIYMIVYGVLQPIIPTKDELIIGFEWDYYVDWNKEIIVLKKYKGNRKKLKIKAQYNINGELLCTHIFVGAFSNCESVKKIKIDNGVEFSKQYLSDLMGENKNIKQIHGLTKDVKYDMYTKKCCPNIKRIEWNFNEKLEKQ